MSRLLPLIFGLAFLPAVASAATLGILPSSSAVEAGGSVSLTVFVSSDTAINAVSGELSFPADMLAVSSVSKAGSLLTLWVQDPSYSNGAGTIQWSGGVPNPGFTGNRGKIVVVQFRAKRAGSATISFTSSEVLANDGSGTNVLTSASPATIVIREAPQPEASPAPREAPKPAPKSIAPRTAAPVATPASSATATASSSGIAASPEQVVTLETGLLPQWLKTGWIALNYLSLALIVVALLALFTFSGWYLSQRFRSYRRRILRRIARTEEEVHAQFEELRQTIVEEVHTLEKVKSKRALTAEETRIINHLKRIIDKTEQAVEREIDDVGR